MNILFLDVDGVLNSHDYLCNKFEQKGKKSLTRREFIDPECMRILKLIVDSFKFHIVIISAWKIIDEEYKLLIDIFSDYDMHIFDRTNNYGSSRGREIHEWICNNNVEKYVVLDDDIFKDYEKYNILPHLVQTSFSDEHALSIKHFEEVSMLMKETKF